MGEEVLLSSKTLHLSGTRKPRARFVGPFRVMEHIGKTGYRLNLRGRFKGVHNIFHVSHIKRHIPGGSSNSTPEPYKWKVKNTSKWRLCYSTEAEAILVSIL